MKTITMILTGLFIMLTPLLTVANTSLPAPENMVRLGHGEVRYLNLIKVYSATLYADNTYLSSDTSRCLVLNYEVSLKPEDMITAANKILEKQYSATQLAPYLKQIENCITVIVRSKKEIITASVIQRKPSRRPWFLTGNN